jgi:hypothetical protein
MVNDVATQADATVISNTGGYSSIKAVDFNTRKRIYTATTNAVSLADHLDKVITLKDVIITPVETTDDKTGEVENYLRTVLIDVDGQAYATGSSGVALALSNLFRIVGEPDQWGDFGLPIEVYEERGKNNYRYMTIRLADEAAESDAKK